MKRFMISAAHKSSGKTTLSIGLCAALTARGDRVQAFKKGPDYIDPMWLAQASGRPCFNLDPYLMQQTALHDLFAQAGADADICLVEGNKGLFDGLALDGSNSNAAVARMLGLPVVLVIDARGMTRGIAPLILGYQAFDPQVQIAGVILNLLGGSRHESKLRAVIEHYTDVPVLGAVAQSSELALAERHLGLIPSNEHTSPCQQIQRLGEHIASQVDLQRLHDIAASAGPFSPQSAPAVMTTEPSAQQAQKARKAQLLGTSEVARPAQTSKIPAAAHPALPQSARPCALASPPAIRIGIARDAAFGFYYQDDLDTFADCGAELVPFSTLDDAALPAGLDGLFIGGGFPELMMQALQANACMRRDVAQAIAAGLPTYAECGGLMYLARSLHWKGQTCQMVGALAADVLMHEKPVGRGYVSLQATAHMPWKTLQRSKPAGTEGASIVRAHEFHYSSLEGLAPDTRFAWKVTRGYGVNGQFDGIVQGNLLASYSHLRSLGGVAWVQAFVQHVRQCKAPQTAAIRPSPVAPAAEFEQCANLCTP